MNMKTKKIWVGILVALIPVLLGLSIWVIAENVIENVKPSSVEETVEYGSTTTPTKSEKKPSVDDLTAEDKALKAEIQAVSDTKVDFRHKKTEKVGAKTHSLTYSAIKGNRNFAANEMITYQNEAGDQFIYHLKSGKLISAVMNSLKTQKTAQSISLDEAEKIAYAYAEKNCDIKTHPLDVKETLEDCYQFSYKAAPICGYDNGNTLFLCVGFDGTIVEVVNYTVAYDYIEVIIDKEKIDGVLENDLKKFAEGSYYATMRISINDGKPQMYTRIYDAEKGGLYNGIGLLDLDYRLKQPSENGDAVIQ